MGHLNIQTVDIIIERCPRECELSLTSWQAFHPLASGTSSGDGYAKMSATRPGATAIRPSDHYAEPLSTICLR